MEKNGGWFLLTGAPLLLDFSKVHHICNVDALGAKMTDI